MKINVVGFSKIDYVSKKSGEQVRGVQIFALVPAFNDYQKGQIWAGKFNAQYHTYEPIYVSDKVLDPDRFSLGAYEVDFDLNGRLTRMEKIKVEG